MCILQEPGRLLDGKIVFHPRLLNYGTECLDFFSPYLNNVVFEPQYDGNGMLLPYMLGKTNREVKKDEQLGFEYGKEFWLNRKHFSTLSKVSQQECMKHYGFGPKDVVKQSTQVDPLSPPTSPRPTNSPRKNTRATKK